MSNDSILSLSLSVERANLDAITRLPHRNEIIDESVLCGESPAERGMSLRHAASDLLARGAAIDWGRSSQGEFYVFAVPV